MCGILGQVSDRINEEAFRQALFAIKYRGPDHTAVFQSDNVALGHNRLSILDLDPRSHQPFHLDGKLMCIVFNGEIYNYREIKNELTGLGHSFITESDTEVVLLSYKQWGVDCLKRFYGMFALCIFDRKEQKLLLARDRFGEKPLFYSNYSDTNFVFGSELKAIKNIMPGSPQIDYTSIIDYLHFGYVPCPKTIYEGVFKLPPGQYVEYSLTTRMLDEPKPFYRVSFAANAKLNLQEKIECYHELSVKAAKQISISDVSLGAFLSGGVDSSGAVAFLKKVHSNIHTFTAGFANSDFDESPYASQMAAHLRVKNVNRKIENGDFIESYQKMVAMYDEPHNDFSFIPTYLICREAAKFHTVMISGDGADEIFCGYPRYHKLAAFEKFKHLGVLNSGIATLARRLPKYSNLRRQAISLGRSTNDFLFYIMCLNFYPEEAPMVFGSELSKVANSYSSRSVIDHYLSEIDSDSLIQKQRYLDIKMTLGDDMLVKVDRASMANSLEVRPFYLHPLLTDFAFTLRPNELVTKGTDKFFLKKILEPSIPKSMLYRKKMGFTFPLKDEILTNLRPFFNECISFLPRTIINTDEVSNIFQMHQKGQRNFALQLNSLMFLGLWCRHNKITS